MPVHVFLSSSLADRRAGGSRGIPSSARRILCSEAAGAFSLPRETQQVNGQDGDCMHIQHAHHRIGSIRSTRKTIRRTSRGLDYAELPNSKTRALLRPPSMPNLARERPTHKILSDPKEKPPPKSRHPARQLTYKTAFAFSLSRSPRHSFRKQPNISSGHIGSPGFLPKDARQ